MNNIICPVPQNQRPLNEFNNIKNSWILSWPLLEKKTFYRKLLFSWFSILPISLIISYGSDYLKSNFVEFIFISSTSSLILPVLLLVRQWLSWRYIFNRLNSENIEYEESGWYDGQVWEKPIKWRAKELLIAQYQVKPILNHIEKVIFIIIFGGLFSLLLIVMDINL
tara:strand:- start:376 stop:876 length:501 start_codon:yes stop_codon:yes gene_type:complete